MKRLAGRVAAGWRASEKLRFLVVGAYNTAFGYATFAMLYLLFGTRIHYLLLLIVSHFVSVTNAFVAHRRVTFAAEGSVWTQYVRFNVSYLGLLMLSLVLMPLAVERLDLHPLVASAVVLAITVIASYFVHRHFSFRRSTGQSD